MIDIIVLAPVKGKGKVKRGNTGKSTKKSTKKTTVKKTPVKKSVPRKQTTKKQTPKKEKEDTISVSIEKNCNFSCSCCHPSIPGSCVFNCFHCSK